MARGIRPTIVAFPSLILRTSPGISAGQRPVLHLTTEEALSQSRVLRCAFPSCQGSREGLCSGCRSRGSLRLSSLLLMDGVKRVYIGGKTVNLRPQPWQALRVLPLEIPDEVFSYVAPQIPGLRRV